LNSSSAWGQVLNYRHEVKPEVADHVLVGLQPETVSSPCQAFPLLPLVASCSVDHFFKWLALE